MSLTFYKEIHQYIYNELKGSDSVQFSSNIEKFKDSTSGGLMIPTISGLMIPNEHSIKISQKSFLGLDKFAEEILPIYSMPTELQAKIFRLSVKGDRKSKDLLEFNFMDSSTRKYEKVNVSTLVVGCIKFKRRFNKTERKDD
jgi:hypothetical protein